MLRSGGKLYSQMRKNVTLLVFMVFNGIGMTRIWGAFSYRGTTEGAVSYTGALNATGYIGRLERSLFFTEGARLCGKNWIFQQDNGQIHTARNSKDFFQANDASTYPEIVKGGRGPLKSRLARPSSEALPPSPLLQEMFNNLTVIW